VTVTTEEEWDGSTRGHDGEGRTDSGDGVDLVAVVATAWRRHRRGHEKFGQPDSVKVKILRIGFKDRTTRGFIGGPQ
jgi:hypothetical protein